MILIIDNGHGADTKGKRSPDGRLLEYKWARDVAALIAARAKEQSITAVILTPEETDVPLRERTRRANEICRQHGAHNCILLSVHINAAGADGKWHDASGWSGWVAPNASARSKRLAALLYAQAEERGLKGNRSVPPERYWTGNFAIVRDTLCPAVLTENLFQDNRQEVDFLLSDKGKQEIAELHVAAVIDFINGK